MKKTILLLLLAPFIVQAQLIPTPLSGYSNPNNWNKPLDSTYIPGKLYRVDIYSLAANQSDLELNYHYLIETDQHFMLSKQSRYIDNITQYTVYTKNVTDYIYSNNKLSCMRYSNQKINSVVLNTTTIDSFYYSLNNISIKDRWSINIDSGTIKHSPGVEYLYDSLNRFVEAKPYNLNPSPNTVYAGYYKIDSFSTSNKMAKVTAYSVSFPIDSTKKDGTYGAILYDSLNRPGIVTTYAKPFPDQGYFRMDSSVYFYTNDKQYPDSILNFSSGPTASVSQKNIFIYTSEGPISQILTYRKSGVDFMISAKEIYTPLLSSAIAEKNDLSAHFRIMPNPSQGSFRLVLPEELSDCTMSISNILGEEVYKQRYINTTEVSVNQGLKPGIYYVTLNTQSGVLSKKLIVQ